MRKNMAKILEKGNPQDGGKEVFVGYSLGGFNGPHIIFWGNGYCLHVYNEDNKEITDKQLLTFAKALEENTNG
jgi:hypothetical protein